MPAIGAFSDHLLPEAQNHLIELLPSRDRQRLLAGCEEVQLVMREELSQRGDVTRNVYFPTTAFVSLVAQVGTHPGIEVGMVGREGMLGVSLVLGVVHSPLRALVQGSGAALRIGGGTFKRELLRSPALQRCLGRYLYVLMAQMAASAACLRFHLIGPRLARWLLMSQDRAHSSDFPVTQDFLSFMLGVRRVGVTAAAGILQRKGLIVYHRGQMQVLDRAGLEEAACSCYAADRQVYAEQLLDPSRRTGSARDGDGSGTASGPGPASTAN